MAKVFNLKVSDRIIRRLVETKVRFLKHYMVISVGLLFLSLVLMIFFFNPLTILSFIMSIVLLSFLYMSMIKAIEIYDAVRHNKYKLIYDGIEYSFDDRIYVCIKIEKE